ncbi:flagellar motor switch phosphatase FliY [Oscillospiraceae bacterium MB08-C2-2]|nr:flagellar motor switch phosphatase FliY [Oscillospiraceae bacterium MB08-C2-2]
MSNANDTLFSNLEIDTIGEIMNISMGSASTAASTLLDSKVSITTPVVRILPVAELEIASLEPAVAVDIRYVEGITGSNILVLRADDIKKILARMMQMDIPEDFEMDEMAQSAICELMNQMMGSSATVLSCFLGRNINISTPVVVQINEFEELKATYFKGEEAVITVSFTLTVDGLIESEFMCIMQVELAKEIIDVSLNFESGEDSDSAPAAVEDSAPQPVVTEAPPTPQAPAAPVAQQAPPAPVQAPPAPAMPPIQQEMPMMPPPGYPPVPGYPPQQAYYPPYPQQPGYPPQQPYGAYPPPAQDSQMKVQSYAYNEFKDGGDHIAGSNLDLVMNVPVTVTVELGRTRRKIREILEFGQGSIVELDKQAGSQVDVIVNGQLIARGDVVVVDDNFSIRITEILKNRDDLSIL